MKKLTFYLTFCLLAFFSCKPVKRPVPRDQWADYRKAYAWLSRQSDSAFYYFNKVTANSKDSLPVATAYGNMAMIQSDAGDYFGAVESLSLSLKFLDENKAADRGALANAYNELGMNSTNLRNYDQAIRFFDRALSLTDDIQRRALTLNNEALAYQKKGDFSRALRLYADVLSKTGSSGAGYARALTNVAITKWLQDRAYPAAPELLTALRIREGEKDLWGQNSSYAHLADYYAGSRRDSALFYARAMDGVARRLNSPDDRLEALEKLVKLVPAGEVQSYFAVYRRLGDSIQTARNAAKNQFALIRYNVEKQKSENLGLQKENAARRYQVHYQQFLLGFAMFVLVAGGILTVIWSRKRKQRMELEKQNGIKGERLKTAKKVHDVLANGLYRLMSQVENEERLDKEILLDDLEVLYERTRDISYEGPDLGGGDFHRVVSALLTAFATAATRVVQVGNTPALWEGLDGNILEELYYILQELMVNMKKHSGATNVAVLFEREGGHLSVHYTDDGKGIPQGTRFKNGLTNTGNRIKAIRGEINFDNHTGKGLEVRITFPLD